ncbi:Ca2-binding protein [Aureococcus anophagefferens]|nr:Ca2-binding protein [Aureococcus anophagefferens]
MVSPPRVHLKAGRLRKTTVVLRRTDVAVTLRDNRTGAPVSTTRRDAPTSVRVELVPIRDDAALEAELLMGGAAHAPFAPPVVFERGDDARADRFGNPKTVAVGAAYRVRVVADERLRLVAPIDPVVFDGSVFGPPKDLAPIEALMLEAARLAKRGRDPLADDELAWEMRRRLAAVLDVRVEPIVCHVVLDVVDARTNLPADDVVVSFSHAHFGTFRAGHRRGELLDVPCPGGGAAVEVDVVAEAADRVQLDPRVVTLRAGCGNPVTLYVRDADVVVHCVDADTGEALEPANLHLETAVGSPRAPPHEYLTRAVDASGRALVAPGVEFAVHAVVPRYRAVGSRTLRATTADFRHLDPHLPMQCTVRFRPASPRTATTPRRRGSSSTTAPGEAGFVVDVAGPRRGAVCARRDDRYDVRCDDGGEERGCAVAELQQRRASAPADLELEDRVELRRRGQGDYTLEATCEGYRQASHCELLANDGVRLTPMTFAVQDFVRLPAREPLRLTVELEALYGHADVRVLDGAGRPLDDADVWIDRHYVGKRRGRVRLRLPGGGAPHGAKVACVCPGYVLIRPATVELRCGACVAVAVEMQRCAALVRVEDARDGAPVDARVCLVPLRSADSGHRAPPKWVQVGSKVEAVYPDSGAGTAPSSAASTATAPTTSTSTTALRRVGPWHVREPGKEVLSKPAPLKADHDFDETLDVQAQAWCDWRTMKPVGVDVQPARYRVVVHDASGDYRQVSHLAPVEIRGAELLSLDDALAAHRVPDKAKAAAPAGLFGGLFGTSKGQGDGRGVAPRCAKATIQVLDGSGLAPLPEASVKLGRVVLGTRRGNVEVDWAKIAPGDSLAPACPWQHAAGARVTGSGVPVAVDAALDGFVQISETTVPFTASWRPVAQGSRLRQVSPDPAAVMTFGRHLWANGLPSDWDYELVVRLERRVTAVDVRVVDAGLNDAVLHDAKAVLGAGAGGASFSAAEGWTQDVEVAPGAKVLRDVAARAALEGYLQLPPRTLDIVVGDGGAPRVLRMRSLDVVVRPVSTYDRKALDDAEWPRAPRRARVADVGCPGWRLTTSAARLVFDVDERVGEFEAHAPGDAVPFEVPMEATTALVRLASVTVANGVAGDVRDSKLSAAETPIPLLDVVAVPLPRLLHAADKVDLEITAFVPDPSLDFVSPRTVTVNPGARAADGSWPAVTDVDAVFKRSTSSLRVSASGRSQVDFREPVEFVDGDFTKSATKDGGWECRRQIVCVPCCATVELNVLDATTRESLPQAAVEFYGARSKTKLPYLLWNSEGTAPDDAGVRTIKLDNVPGGGDEVQLAVSATLPGYTHIDPKLFELRATRADAAVVQLELLMRKYYVVADVVDPRGDELRVRGAGVELRPATLADATDDVAKRQRAAGVVTFKPADVTGQSPVPVVLGVVYDVVATHLEPPRAVQREHLFRGAWRPRPETIRFREEDFHELERKASEATRKMKKNAVSDDLRYPFLKRIVERPTWRALHSWTLAARAKRRPDLRAPPYALKVRAMATHCAVDVAVLDPEGTALTKAAPQNAAVERVELVLRRVDVAIRVTDGDGAALREPRSRFAPGGARPAPPTAPRRRPRRPSTRPAAIADSDDEDAAADAELEIDDDGASARRRRAATGSAASSPGLQPRTSLVAIADAGVRQHWAARGVDAPLVFTIALARAVAHVGVTVRDLAGAVLPDAALEVAGQKLRAGDHSVPAAPLVELDAGDAFERALSAPPAELEDSDPPQEFEDVRYPFLKRIVERPAWRGLHSWAAAAGAVRAPNTEPFAALAELKARRRAEGLALTRRHYPVVVTQVDEPASVVCGVRYVVAVDVVAEDGYAPPALRQVSHDSVDAAALFQEQQWLDRVPKDGCDFRVDPVPLVVKMERDANLILGATRTRTRRCPTAASSSAASCRRRPWTSTGGGASLVVLMRRALVVVDVRDGGGDESLFERLFAAESSAKCVVALTRTDDAHKEPLRPVRPPGDGEAPVFAVEPDAAYDLEVYSKDRVTHRRAPPQRGLFLASSEPHALVVRLLRSTVRVDLSVVDAVTKAPLAGRAAVGKTDVGEARGEVDVALPPADAGVVRLPLRCELDGYVLRAPRFVDCARGAVARCALELRSADVAVKVVLAGPRHGGPDNADDCAVALAPRRSGQAVAAFGAGPLRSVARVVEGAAYAWALTGDSGDAYALVREDAESRPRFQAPSARGLRVVLRAARVALRVVDGSLDGDGSRMKEPLPGAWPEVRGLGSYDAALSAVDGEGFCILDPEAAYRLGVRWDALGRGPGADDDASLDLPRRFRAWASDGDVSGGVFAEGVRHVHASLADLPVDELAGVAKALRRAVGRAPRDADAAAAANGVVLAVPAAAFERPGDVRVDVEVEPVTCELLLEACEEATRVEIPLHACHVVAAWELRGELSAATETLERARGIFQVAAPGGGAAATLILRLDVPGYAPWEARAEPTTLVDVWDASSRALLAAGEADARDVAPVVAELPKYVLVSPLTFPLKWSGDVRRVTLHMRKATVVATAYDARGRGRAAPFARVSVRAATTATARAGAVVAAAGRVEADVSLGAAYSLTAAADGWAQPTVVDVNLVVVDAATEEDLDEALVSIHGIDVGENRGIVTLDLAELRARGAGAWVAKDGALALPLRVSARLDGFLDVEEHRWVRAGAREPGTAAATCTVLLRRSEVAALCVDAASGDPVKDLISVTLIPEFGWAEDAATAAAKAAGSVHFDRVSRADVLRWIAAEKDEAEAADLFDDEFAEPRPAINAAVVAREATLRALATPSCSTRELLKALGDLAPADVPGDELRRVVDEMSTHGTRSVAVGARYAVREGRKRVRASHVDYVAADPAQFVRFDARGWRSIPPAQPRVVTIPVTPVFVDVAITVVDDATSSEVEDAAVSLGDECLGLTRKARLRSFFTNSIGPKDVAVALAHPRYVLLEPRTVTLAPGAGETSIACRARRATVALRPTRDGVPVDGAVCALNDVDASLPRGAGVELGAAYVVSATHDALLQIEARTLSFDEHDFRGVLDASQPLIVDVPMEERGSYFTVTCVDEVSGDDVPECEVRVGDHALGVARGPVNEVAVRRPGHKGPIRVVAVAPAYVLASAADDCLTCVYAALKPSAGADTVLELRLRPMRVVVAVTHASEPAADLSSTHIAVVARDGLRRPPANLVIERIDVEELRETPQKPPLPTAASSRSVASLGNVTFDGMHKQQKWAWLVSGFPPSRDGYYVVARHAAARARDVAAFGLEDVLRRPRFDALKCDVLLEPVDGGVDLDVCDVDVEDQGALAKLPAADVALGHHRVGAWRGRVQLIEIAGGGRPRHLDVSSRLARFVLVGFGPLSAGFAGSRAPPPLRAAHEAAVDVGMRRAMASFVARNRSDGATLTGYDDAARLRRHRCGDRRRARRRGRRRRRGRAAGAIAAVLDGAALVRLDDAPGEDRRVPLRLLARRRGSFGDVPAELLPGDRVDAPERLYVVECHKEGYRQVSHRVEGTLEPFALPASLFAGNRSGGPVIIDVFVEKAAAELLFDVVDSDGAALEARRSSDVQVAASLAGYAQLAPAGRSASAAAPGPTKVAVVLERYVLHVGVLAADGAPANGATVTARFDGAGRRWAPAPGGGPTCCRRARRLVVEAALEGSKQVDHLDPVAFESLSWFASPAAAPADLAQASEDAAAFARRDRSHPPRERVERRLFFRRQGLAFYKWRLETTCLDADWDAAAPAGSTPSSWSASRRRRPRGAAGAVGAAATPRCCPRGPRRQGELELSAARTVDARAVLRATLGAAGDRGVDVAGAFGSWDADWDGKLARGELCHAFASLRIALDAAEVAAILALVEDDGQKSDVCALLRGGGARRCRARRLEHALRRLDLERGVLVEAVFAEWDANGNGLLSRKELKAGLATMGLFEGVDDADVDAVFERTRASRADGVSLPDFIAFLGWSPAAVLARRLRGVLLKAEQLGTSLDAAFAAWDDDGDGRVSPAELAAGLKGLRSFGNLLSGDGAASERVVLELVKLFDVDGDGAISVRELYRFMGRDATVVTEMRLRRVIHGSGIGAEEAFRHFAGAADEVSSADLAAGVRRLPNFEDVTEDDAAKLAALYDATGDGTTSLNEFVRQVGATADVGEAEATLLLKLRGAVNEPAAPGERPRGFRAFKLACSDVRRALDGRARAQPTVAVDDVLAFARRGGVGTPQDVATRLGEPSPHDGALRAHPDAAADKFGRLVASYEAAGLDVGAFFASLGEQRHAISPGELYAGLRRHDAFADMTRQDALRVLRHVDSSRNGAIETADVAAGPWTEAFGAARAAAALVAFADDGGALASLFSGAGALGAAALLDACRATEWPDLKVLEQRDLEAIIAQAGSDDSLDARELLAFLGTWRAYRATFAGNGSDTAETYATRAGFVVRKTAVADVRGTSAAGASDRWDLDVAWPEAADVRALRDAATPEALELLVDFPAGGDARELVATGDPGYAVRLGDGGDRRCVRKWRLGAVGAFKGTAWTDASTPVTFSDAAFDAMREAARAKQEEEIHDPRYRFCARAARHRLWRGLLTWTRVAGAAPPPRADPLLAIPLEIRVGATSAVAKLDVVDDEGRRLPEARVTVDGADKGLARGSLAIETEEDASGDVAVDFGAVLEGYVQLPPTRVVLEGGRETRVSLRMRRCDVHFSVVDEATGDALPAAELEIQSDGRATRCGARGRHGAARPRYRTAVAVDVGGDDTWLLLGPLSLDLRDVPAEPRSITIRVRRAAVVVDVVEDRAGAPAQRLVHATVGELRADLGVDRFRALADARQPLTLTLRLAVSSVDVAARVVDGAGGALESAALALNGVDYGHGRSVAVELPRLAPGEPTPARLDVDAEAALAGYVQAPESRRQRVSRLLPSNDVLAPRPPVVVHVLMRATRVVVRCFSGSDFDGDEPGPLVVEVAFEPVALRVTVVLVEETPTDAATFLDDVAVSLGGTAATRDRALTLPLEALAAAGGTLRLPVAALGSRHVLVGPSELVHDLEGAGVDGDHEATLQLTMRAASVEADALEAKDDGVALAKVDGATVAVAPTTRATPAGRSCSAGRPRPAVVELGRAYRVSARCDRMRLVSGDRFEIKPADVLALPPGGVSTISVVLARMLRATATLCVRALYDVARDRETPLQSAARAYDGAAFLAVDAAGRHGELDAAHEDPVRDDPPSEFAAVTIRAASDEGRGEGQGMGVARGAVEISVPPSGAVEARAALRGWAQLPPY